MNFLLTVCRVYGIQSNYLVIVKLLPLVKSEPFDTDDSVRAHTHLYVISTLGYCVTASDAFKVRISRHLTDENIVMWTTFYGLQTIY